MIFCSGLSKLVKHACPEHGAQGVVKTRPSHAPAGSRLTNEGAPKMKRPVKRRMRTDDREARAVSGGDGPCTGRLADPQGLVLAPQSWATGLLGGAGFPPGLAVVGVWALTGSEIQTGSREL